MDFTSDDKFFQIPKKAYILKTQSLVHQSRIKWKAVKWTPLGLLHSYLGEIKSYDKYN